MIIARSHPRDDTLLASETKPDGRRAATRTGAPTACVDSAAESSAAWPPPRIATAQGQLTDKEHRLLAHAVATYMTIGG